MQNFKQIVTLIFFSFFTLNAAGFLMPDEAFKPYAKVTSQGDIVAGVQIAEEIYLYKEKLKITLKEDPVLSIASIEEPEAVEHMGDKVYLESPEFIIHLEKREDLKEKRSVSVRIAYQGCSEQGLCYEPTTKEFVLQVDMQKIPLASGLKKLNTPKKQAITEPLSQTDRIADTMKSSGFLAILATFFFFGLLLSLTPCVFPMIPIISGLIISQGEGITTKRAFFLSLVYVLAMAVAYTIAGVLAGLFGSNLQAALQTPWVVYSFAAVFVALALSMFGYYELKLPDALVSRVSKNSNRGGVIGVGIMGFLSALIVGPCVAAPLAGALVYIGQTGDALLGGSALFVMSLGMGVPLIVVGVSAGKFMPRPGAWMTLVNAVFGVLMLLVAVWMLEKVVSSDVSIFLYGALGIGFALYLGAFEKSGHIAKRAFAFLLFIYAFALVLSVFAGAPSLQRPLGFLNANKAGGLVPQKSSEVALQFQVVHSQKQLDDLLEKNRGKKVLVDFSAAWCTACKELEEVTFADARVAKAMQAYVLIRADLTDNTAEEKALAKAYGVFGPPAILFFDKEGNWMKSRTVVGFIEPDAFLQQLGE